ncbi:hypothetical protein FOA43_003281 [Brettanomyces nanus]|uniref:Uncharacterized protein n=1 Tax=Eeniella nana TaxID=13502 RepID=A0A875S6F4_EENNA|nr:uncharacterized protein FOA43_003281 [Brettanomyces nanus]QPG75895.1 hypothetical protein FOA43_003281 [Brettanomyces nanus]
MDAYMDQDVILEKKAAMEIEQKVVLTEKQLFEMKDQQKEQIDKKSRLDDTVKDMKKNVSNINELVKLKQNNLKMELNRHKDFVEEQKKKVYRVFGKRLDEIKSRFADLAKSSVSDDETERNRRQRFEKLRDDNELTERTLKRARTTIQLRLEKLENELQLKESNDNDEILHLRIELNNKEAKMRKSNKCLDEYKGEVDRIRKQNRILATEVDQLGEFRGSLDDKFKELKVRRVKLLDELDETKQKVAELLSGRVQTGLKKHNESKKKYFRNRRRRLLIENCIDKHQGIVRKMYAICDTPIEIKGFDVVNCEFDIHSVLDIYLEDSLQGVSHKIVIVGEGLDRYISSTKDHLLWMSQRDKYKQWRVDIKENCDATCLRVQLTKDEVVRKSEVQFISLPLTEEGIRQFKEVYDGFGIVKLKHDKNDNLIEKMATK